MQILLNLLLAALAFVFTSWLLGALGLGGVINTLISLVVAVVVFLNRPADRLR